MVGDGMKLGRPMTKEKAKVATTRLRASIVLLLESHTLLDGMFVLSSLMGEGLAMLESPQRQALMQDMFKRIEEEADGR
jgi:hypothetical protein